MHAAKLVTACLVLVAVTSCDSRPVQTETDIITEKPYKIPYDADEVNAGNWMSDVEEKQKLNDSVMSDQEEEEEEEEEDAFSKFKKKHKQLIIIGIGIMATFLILFITNCVNIFIAFNSSSKVDDGKDKKDKSKNKKDSDSKKSSSKSKKKVKPSKDKNKLKRSVAVSDSE